MKKITLSIVFCITSLLVSFAQEDSTKVDAKKNSTNIAEEQAEKEKKPSTLKEQFYDLKNKSNSWNGYKVIKDDKLISFWETVEDSITTKEDTIVKLEGIIKEKNQKISEQENALKVANDKIKDIQFDIAHIDVFGVSMDKSNYVIISWTIIILLILALLVSIVRTKQSISISKKKKTDFEELNEEFEEYKKRVLEKETKIRRQLTTEMNKVEELKQKLRKI